MSRIGASINNFPRKAVQQGLPGFLIFPRGLLAHQHLSRFWLPPHCLTRSTMITRTHIKPQARPGCGGRLPRGFALTSANISDAGTLPDTAATAGRVTLVGPGTLGSGKAQKNLEIHLQPTLDAKYTRPAPGNGVPPVSMFYPWAAYRSGSTAPIYQHGAVTSWANLADYATR